MGIYWRKWFHETYCEELSLGIKERIVKDLINARFFVSLRSAARSKQAGRSRLCGREFDHAVGIHL